VIAMNATSLSSTGVDVHVNRYMENEVVAVRSCGAKALVTCVKSEPPVALLRE
jgi:hypothetical protein